MKDVMVIGGGAAGAAVFGELLERPDAGVVHWIVDRAWLGRGVAYATTDDRHLLNIRANGMGLFVGQPEGFLHHVANRIPAVRDTDFLPRRLFGEFIESQLRRKMDAAHATGRRFAIHLSPARDIDVRTNGYAVGMANGQMLHADAVVLALGSAPPRPLKAVTQRALASDTYELDPWNLSQRSRAPRRLVVIGTGLTMVDTMLSAATRWPDAELIAVSRHGLLPMTHEVLPTASYPFQRELNAALLACTRVAPMLRLVRAALLESPAINWRSLVDGMRSINAALWQSLSHRERLRFLRHVRWLWEAARHRMAPASSTALRRLIDTGRLRVHAAHVLAVDGADPLTLTLRNRLTQRMATLEADLVVQATGLDTAVTYTSHPLLSQLLKDGLAIADPLHLGLNARPDGCLINAGDEVQPGLYAIGALLRGVLWECTAMPEIRDAAQVLAEMLASQPSISQCPTPVREGADAPRWHCAGMA